jgi:hypothetical protein
MREAENAARAQLVENSGDTDPFLHLIDVFSDVESFNFVPDTTVPAEGPPSRAFVDREWNSIPLILCDNRKMPVGADPPSAVVPTLSAFSEAFYGLCPALEGDAIDWTGERDGTGIGLFVAGGSVLAALLQSYSQGDSENTDMTANAFSASDIDLFLVDRLRRPAGEVREAALNKMALLEEALRAYQTRPKPTNQKTHFSGYGYDYLGLVVMRTSRTVSFVVGAPQRHIQVIMRIYASPAEVLLGFDLDCVACGFDGTRVHCLPRCRRAITNR